MKYLSLIDESGNTGADLLEQSQPLFTLACVSVPEVSAVYIRERVNAAFESLRDKDEKEAKARSWLKLKSKREAMASLLEDVRLQDGFVTLVVVDKTWMLAALVVQNFLDPEYNPKAGIMAEQLFDPAYARQVTAYFHSVIQKGNPEIIAAAFRHTTEERVRRAVDYLVSITDDRIFKEIIAGCDAERLYREDLSTNSWKASGVEYSPNMAAFAQLGRLLSNRLERVSSQTDMVFDHCTQFDLPFNELKDFCKGFRHVEESERILGINTWDGYIDNFETANSKSEPLLFLADIAATCTTKTVEKILRGMPLNDFDYSMLKVIGRSGRQDLAWYVMDPDDCRKIQATIASVHIS